MRPAIQASPTPTTDQPTSRFRSTGGIRVWRKSGPNAPVLPKGIPMKTALLGILLGALPLLGRAEYQIDFEPSSLPRHGLPFIYACFIAVDGTPLGCFDAVLSLTDGSTEMYHAVWTNDSQIQEAWFSSMTLMLQCNGHVLESTLEFAPFEVMYYAGPANPPAAPTVFPIDPAIDCRTYTADAEDLPGAFSLGTAFPNPFNPSTTIRFSLSTTDRVTLTVFNLAGERVATLANEILARGAHDVPFDASALSSGVYIYTIEAGGVTATSKMILAK
ncbi:MAG: T9SS type A sorting domain-containing protein [Candidatus Cloacimonetes bacterium]|nr:T9SS type A sorting domain-containing protein [Candidatus Cloacimonadota bacterium]